MQQLQQQIELTATSVGPSLLLLLFASSSLRQQLGRLLAFPRFFLKGAQWFDAVERKAQHQEKKLLLWLTRA